MFENGTNWPPFDASESMYKFLTTKHDKGQGSFSPPLPLQVRAHLNHTTLERNIQTLPQRCLINDVVVPTFFVGSTPNKGIMSLLPQGQS